MSTSARSQDPCRAAACALCTSRACPADSNLMVKVPATEAGIAAIEELTAEGVNVNVTRLFTADRYEQAARAY